MDAEEFKTWQISVRSRVLALWKGIISRNCETLGFLLIHKETDSFKYLHGPSSLFCFELSLCFLLWHRKH